MFTIYGKQDCPYCVHAKDHLDRVGKEYVYHDVMEDPNARSALLEAVPNVKTVPQIFDGDKHVGGYDDLKAYLQMG